MVEEASITKTNIPYTQDLTNGLRLMDIIDSYSEFKDLTELQTFGSASNSWSYHWLKPIIKESLLQLHSAYHTQGL